MPRSAKQLRIMKRNMKEENKIRYRVVSSAQEAEGIFTITLEHPAGTLPEYIAGQYITIYFPELGTPEGKAYTLSSAPSEKRFSITVKAIGEFSNRLCGMKSGETLLGSEPYGYFGSESQDSPLCMIAAGVGITPFRSIIVEIAKRNPSRAIELFYSCRTLGETAFRAELDTLAKKNKNLRIHYSITREDAKIPGIARERLSAEKICKALKLPEKSEFLICGSISFTRDLWRGLRAAGIPEENILTEAFFSH